MPAGRPPEYTPEELQAAVDVYFDDLRAYLPLKIDGEPVVDEQGHPILREIAINPPTVAGICNHLGILKQTWGRWRSDPENPLRPIACQAQQRIEQFLEEKLTTNKSADGVKFNLVNNFAESWKEKQELELGPETRASEALTAISLRDKLTLIIQASEKAKRTMLTHPEEGEDNAEPDDKD